MGGWIHLDVYRDRIILAQFLVKYTIKIYFFPIY